MDAIAIKFVLKILKRLPIILIYLPNPLAIGQQLGARADPSQLGEHSRSQFSLQNYTSENLAGISHPRGNAGNGHHKRLFDVVIALLSVAHQQFSLQDIERICVDIAQANGLRGPGLTLQ